MTRNLGVWLWYKVKIFHKCVKYVNTKSDIVSPPPPPPPPHPILYRINVFWTRDQEKNYFIGWLTMT